MIKGRHPTIGEHMKNKLKYLLDIQLFGEDDPTPIPPAAPEIDYDKLADTIAKRTAASEESALKGILKEQGISKDDLSEAVKVYRENKVNKAKEEQERINKIIEENSNFKKQELMKNVTSEAKAIAKELNVRDDRFEKLMALSDKSKFMDDTGKIDKVTIKAEFEEQLKDLPEFTSKKDIKVTTVRNSKTPPEMTDDEAYRKNKYGKSRYYRG